ncbi:hypothetical protein EVAR_81560_1 [Eumeta japonica]|uniref:Uncharacterized protein n=1 Tax=Eumeta variegata TaxID=151549 RepID=A0A4C1V156_EUMVA|nr:hypothetical protein EVAR_81560_1 [Eumeta japonica]
MSIDQASPLVPIKPQVTLQNSAFIKNSHNRSSFCGVTPSPTNGNGTLKTFAVNRKSWSGNGTLPLQQFAPDADRAPQLATFRSGTGTFPRNRERNNNGNLPNGILTPNGNSVQQQAFRGNEVRRSGCTNGRRYAEIGNWSKRKKVSVGPAIAPRALGNVDLVQSHRAPLSPRPPSAGYFVPDHRHVTKVYIT